MTFANLLNIFVFRASPAVPFGHVLIASILAALDTLEKEN
jgi:hypothetical protein